MPQSDFRSSRPEVSLGKSVLKICSKLKGETSCRSVISIKLQNNFIEITLQHGCSPVNSLHIFFRTPFPNYTFGWVLLRLNSESQRSNQKKEGRSTKELVQGDTQVIPSLTLQGGTKQLTNGIKERSGGYKSKNMCNMFTINVYK